MILKAIPLFSGDLEFYDGKKNSCCLEFWEMDSVWLYVVVAWIEKRKAFIDNTFEWDLISSLNYIEPMFYKGTTAVLCQYHLVVSWRGIGVYDVMLVEEQ